MTHRSVKLFAKIKLNQINEIIKNNTKNYAHKLQFDGCSKGNPGLAGSGSVLYNNDIEIWNDFTFLGDKLTNNYAEYMGLIIGLKKAVELGIKELIVEGDSMLVIKQMKGEYKINSENLLLLYKEAKVLEQNFDNVVYTHIYRDFNKKADALSNIAVETYVNKNCKI
jgi:ribonuclease HI